jgi:hypothetical protein
MNPENKPRTESDERKRRFLETGGSSYLQAMAAMAKFRLEVYESCKRVLQLRCQELEKAVGTRLDATTIKPHAWQERIADQLGWDGSDTVLGAKMPLAGGMLRCYLWWTYEKTDTPVIRAVAAVAPKQASAIDGIVSLLKRAPGSKIEADGEEVWLEEILTTAGFPDCERKLDNLMSEWIGLLQKIGGLKLE